MRNISKHRKSPTLHGGVEVVYAKLKGLQDGKTITGLTIVEGGASATPSPWLGPSSLVNVKKNDDGRNDDDTATYSRSLATSYDETRATVETRETTPTENSELLAARRNRTYETRDTFTTNYSSGDDDETQDALTYLSTLVFGSNHRTKKGDGKLRDDEGNVIERKGGMGHLVFQRGGDDDDDGDKDDDKTDDLQITDTMSIHQLFNKAPLAMPVVPEVGVISDDMSIHQLFNKADVVLERDDQEKEESKKNENDEGVQSSSSFVSQCGQEVELAKGHCNFNKKKPDDKSKMSKPKTNKMTVMLAGRKKRAPSPSVSTQSDSSSFASPSSTSDHSGDTKKVENGKSSFSIKYGKKLVGVLSPRKSKGKGSDEKNALQKMDHLPSKPMKSSPQTKSTTIDAGAASTQKKGRNTSPSTVLSLRDMLGARSSPSKNIVSPQDEGSKVSPKTVESIPPKKGTPSPAEENTVTDIGDDDDTKGDTCSFSFRTVNESIVTADDQVACDSTSCDEKRLLGSKYVPPPPQKTDDNNEPSQTLVEGVEDEILTTIGALCSRMVVTRALSGSKHVVPEQTDERYAEEEPIQTSEEVEDETVTNTANAQLCSPTAMLADLQQVECPTQVMAKEPDDERNVFEVAADVTYDFVKMCCRDTIGNSFDEENTIGMDGSLVEGETFSTAPPKKTRRKKSRRGGGSVEVIDMDVSGESWMNSRDDDGARTQKASNARASNVVNVSINDTVPATIREEQSQPIKSPKRLPSLRLRSTNFSVSGAARISGASSLASSIKKTKRSAGCINEDIFLSEIRKVIKQEQEKHEIAANSPFIMKAATGTEVAMKEEEEEEVEPDLPEGLTDLIEGAIADFTKKGL